VSAAERCQTNSQYIHEPNQCYTSPVQAGTEECKIIVHKYCKANTFKQYLTHVKIILNLMFSASPVSSHVCMETIPVKSSHPRS